MSNRNISLHQINNIDRKHSKSIGALSNIIQPPQYLYQGEKGGEPFSQNILARHKSSITNDESMNQSDSLHLNSNSTFTSDPIKSKLPPFSAVQHKKIHNNSKSNDSHLDSIIADNFSQDPKHKTCLQMKEPSSEQSTSPQRPTQKQSSSILGSFSNIKASQLIPINKTEIIGISMVSQSQQQQHQRQTPASKSTINRFGLSLKPLCTFHKNSQIRFICVDGNCTSRERVICEECVTQFGHSFHEVKTIQEYLFLISSSHETFDRKYYHIRQMQEQLENPPFISDILLEINQIKKSMCLKLDQIQQTVLDEYKQTLQELKIPKNPQQTYKSTPSVNGQTPRQKQSNLSLQSSKNQIDSQQNVLQEEIPYESIQKEVKRLEEIKGFWDDIRSKNFFDLSKTEIAMTLAMIQSKSFVSLETMQTVITEKYKSLQFLFSESMKMYSQKLSISLDSVFDLCKLEIPTPPKAPSSDFVLNQLQINLIQMEGEIKMKKSQMNMVLKQIQSHVAGSKNKKNSSQSDLNPFPYNSYSFPCGHLAKRGAEGNTVPIFECCNQAFQCIECHSQLSQHPPKITNPSKRYCMKCLSIFYVNYPTDLSINCNDCLS